MAPGMLRKLKSLTQSKKANKNNRESLDGDPRLSASIPKASPSSSAAESRDSSFRTPQAAGPPRQGFPEQQAASGIPRPSPRALPPPSPSQQLAPQLSIKEEESFLEAAQAVLLDSAQAGDLLSGDPDGSQGSGVETPVGSSEAPRVQHTPITPIPLTLEPQAGARPEVSGPTTSPKNLSSSTAESTGGPQGKAGTSSAAEQQVQPAFSHPSQPQGGVLVVDSDDEAADFGDLDAPLGRPGLTVRTRESDSELRASGASTLPRLTSGDSELMQPPSATGDVAMSPVNKAAKAVALFRQLQHAGKNGSGIARQLDFEDDSASETISGMDGELESALEAAQAQIEALQVKVARRNGQLTECAVRLKRKNGQIQEAHAALSTAKHELRSLQRAALQEGDRLSSTPPSGLSPRPSTDGRLPGMPEARSPLMGPGSAAELARQLERLQQDMALLKDELNQVREERAVAEMERAALNDELELVAADLQAAQSARAALDAHMEQLRAEVERRRELTRASLPGTPERRAGASGSNGTPSHDTAALRARVAELEEQLEISRAELDEARAGFDAEVERVREEALGASAWRRDADAEIARLMAEAAALAAGRDDAEAEARELRSAREAAREELQLTQAELAVERGHAGHLAEALAALQRDTAYLVEADLLDLGAFSGPPQLGGVEGGGDPARMAELGKKLKELTERNAELEAALAEAQAAATGGESTLAAENEVLVARIAQLEDDLEALRPVEALAEEMMATLEAQQARCAELERDAAVLRAAADGAGPLAGEMAGLVAEMGRLRADLAVMEREKAAAVADAQAAAGELAAARAEVEALRADAARAATAAAERERKLREELDTKLAALGDLEGVMAQIDQLGALQQELADREAQLAELPQLRIDAAEVAELRRAAGELAGVQTVLASRDAEVAEASGQLSAAQERIAELTHQIHLVTTKVVGLQQQLYDKEEEVDEVKQAHAGLSLTHAELRSAHEHALAVLKKRGIEWQA